MYNIFKLINGKEVLVDTADCLEAALWKAKVIGGYHRPAVVRKETQTTERS